MKKKLTLSQCREFVKKFLALYKSAELNITSVAVAYYILVSIFPMLLLLANLLPYFQFDIDQILSILKDFLPSQLYPTVASMVSAILTKPSNTWLGISIATTLWSISASMSVLQIAVNKAYGVLEHRDFIISRIVGIFLGIGLQVIITVGVLAITFGKTLLLTLGHFLDFDHGFFENLANQTVPMVYVLLFLGLMMLYYFLPNVRIRKIKFVLPGALFVIVVMSTVGRFFALYVESYAARWMDFRLVTFIIILVLMLWFVFMANILITGAVLNATYQSMVVEEFSTRPGDIGAVLDRIKTRFKNLNTKDDDENKSESD
jgi:membrane protein